MLDCITPVSKAPNPKKTKTPLKPAKSKRERSIICLKFSIIWVILSGIDVKVIHPYFVYKIFDSINGIWPGLSILFILALFMDEILTFIDFRKGRQII